MSNLRDILSLIRVVLENAYGIGLLVSLYFPIKKCFWKGNRNRVVLFLITVLVNPVMLINLTVGLVPGLLSKGISTGVITFIPMEYKNLSMAATMLIINVVFLALVIFVSRLVGKWLGATNTELVTFVYLMHSITVSLSMRQDLVAAGDRWLLNTTTEIISYLALYAACIFLYFIIVKDLSALAEERSEIDMRLFVVPPTIFMFFYNFFLAVAYLYADRYPFKDGEFLIILFSTCIFLLFIWAFYVIIKNINSTNEAIKAKALAAEMAVQEAKIEADLSIAKSIQTSTLPCVFPPFPERKDFELFASMNAAKEVGGDFYDFYMLGQDTLGFLIADVSGKSIPGAMFMMRGKAIIKSLAESGMPPADVFSIANEKLCEGNDAEQFITAWMGYLDLHTGVVHVANAGHNPPVLIRNGRAEYVVLKPGLMLAGMDGMIYKDQTLQLQKGDILYLYTDGVTEAMDADENQYGEDRLIELLSFRDHYPAPSGDNGIAGAVCELVTADIDRFVKGAEQSDDITMLCVRFLGKP